MTYELAIGDRSYSSWSLRGWLLFAAFGIPVRCATGRLYTPDFDRLLGEFSPARLVPALRLPEGEVIGDTLAIAETLAELHPEAGHWPEDATDRAIARSIVAEMHSGFSALRGACPMNLKHAWVGFEAKPEVMTDMDRITQLWRRAWGRGHGAGNWLFGRYTVADAFFAPVAARVACYGLKVDADAAGYVARHLEDPVFRRWRAMGIAENYDQASYDRKLPRRSWPGPVSEAKAADHGPSVNPLCPYSGKPVTHFMTLGGRTWGFCNPFCRDKTVVDPQAWPAFAEIYQS